MTTAHHQPDADGVLEDHDDGTAAVRFTRLLAHPVDRVWAALTEPSQLIQWWGDARFDLTEGGDFTLTWLNTDDQGGRTVLRATITRLQPPRLLELTGEPHGVLRWELRPDGAGTRLTFSSTLRLPEEYRARVLAGWHFHLDALAGALDGKPADLAAVSGWEPIHDRYVAQLSPGRVL
jgi:uncharacterized protein YndB with AHSA1/START domain